jgi:hydrogenase maturation protein HypF
MIVSLPAANQSIGIQRLRVRVRGTVQGVGFRPFVYRLARRLGLEGWVCNDGGGVLAEVQGAAVEDFLNMLREEPPALARVGRIEVQRLQPRPIDDFKPINDFKIVASAESPVTTGIGADAAICGDCLAELCDPEDRRHGYPFTNCTNCGPRYTITRALPYDRPNTSMAEFALCEACAREYHDPADRRFHAQPNACPVCGPLLDLPIAEILDHIRRGRIVALKGLGGFHLACDARNAAAVTGLRHRKNREEKPFAVMVANVPSARRLARLDAVAHELLTSASRPIVLLERQGDALARAVAPDLSTIGLMLPYTPLHYLLFHEAAGRPPGMDWLSRQVDLALVMTSANAGGDPLVIDDREARRRLAGIADVVVGHDRPIVVRCDDSVMRVTAGQPIYVRRARGTVPQAIKLARPVPSILAVGGHLKNTVCITRGDEAFLSQHVGDLDNAATCRFFEETIDHLLSVLQVEPELVAHDRHPDFHATRYALGSGLPTIAVQHHHAHVAAVMAEHRIEERLLGLALDGFGLGSADQSWGGELLLVEGPRWRRVGHLSPLPQPGGDAATTQPWRMGAAALARMGRVAEIPERFARQVGAALVAQTLERSVNTPPTSSCGRLFDAACGLLGVQLNSSFEGQAPMRLEALVTRPEVMRHGWRLQSGVLDMLPLLERLLECGPEAGANLFHGTLIAATSDWVEAAASAHAETRIILSGGCFLNRVLTEGLSSALARRGIEVVVPRQAPPNDGALSLGQAWVAALSCENGVAPCA